MSKDEQARDHHRLVDLHARLADLLSFLLGPVGLGDPGA